MSISGAAEAFWLSSVGAPRQSVFLDGTASIADAVVHDMPARGAPSRQRDPVTPVRVDIVKLGQ